MRAKNSSKEKKCQTVIMNTVPTQRLNCLNYKLWIRRVLFEVLIMF